MPPTTPDHPVQSATAVRQHALRRRPALLAMIAIVIFLCDLAVAALLHSLLPPKQLLSHHIVDALALSALLLPVIVWSLRRNSDCSTLQRRHDALSIQTAEFERLAMVAQRTTNAVVITDADRRITWVNEGFTRISGYSLAEAVGLNPGALLQSDKTDPATIAAMRAALDAGAPFRGEILNRSKSGAEYWLDLDIQPLHDETGALTGFVAIESDITQRRAQEHRLAVTITSAGLGTWDWNIATGHVVFNDHWSRMLSYEPTDIVPHVDSWANLVHPDDLPEVTRQLDAHVAGLTPEYHSEHRLLRKDGTWAWVLDAGQVTEFDATGKPSRATGIQLDISAAKELEAGLSQAKQRAEAALREVSALRTALDEHSIISVADRSGKIIEVNTGFCRISGYDRDELLGHDHRKLNSGVHPKAFWINVWRTIASGRAWRGEVCNRAKDGSLYWVDSTIVPCRGTDGSIEKYVSIRFDITQQKSAETALLEARAQADAASRSKTEFLANMSHEIRTPMTAILGFTDLLSESINPECSPKQRQDYIDTIRRHGEHLLAIINDILDISKIEAGKLNVENVPTSPHQVINDVLKLMSIKARSKGLVLQSIEETPIPQTINTDPLRLRQILVNLIGNAIKFTEIGGVIIRVGFDAHEPARLTFCIEDTGIGLSPEQQDRIFSAFSQADTSTTRKYGGTGLGLQICKRLVTMLGGQISCSSILGKGSEFTFYIRVGVTGATPFVQAATRSINQSPDTAINEPAPPELPLQGVRILLAEDGPDNVRLISFHLRKAGADVRSVTNGRCAVEALTHDGTLDAPILNPAPVDIILTDMQMPEMDGYAATRLLRAKGCTLPIVALTAHAMDGDAEKCLAAGCDDYATKPLDRARLIEVCQNAARLQTHRSAAQPLARAA